MTLINQDSQFDADLMLVSHVVDVVSEYYNRSYKTSQCGKKMCQKTTMVKYTLPTEMYGFA